MRRRRTKKRIQPNVILKNSLRNTNNIHFSPFFKAFFLSDMTFVHHFGQILNAVIIIAFFVSKEFPECVPLMVYQEDQLEDAT